MKTLLTISLLFLAIASFSQNYDDLVKDGRSLLSQRKYNEAYAKFQEAQKLDIKIIDAKYGCAVALGQKSWITKDKDDCNKALEALKVVEKINDKFANLNYNFSIVYFELGDFQKALVHIDKQLEHGDSKDGDLYYQKGLVLGAQNKDKEACKMMKKASKLGSPGASELVEENCK